MHRILLASCLLAVTAIQCSRPSRRTKPPARAELEQLRQKLRGLNFGPEAAEALQDLENLAHRTESPLAVEAWYLLGLHRLDWLLTGILEGNGKRIRDLLAHLGLDTGCCRRRCIRSGVLASSPTCTSSLRGRLVAPFEAIRRIEGPGKLGYAGLAAELVQMADLLVRGRDPAVHHRLLGERDPAGTRARILFACLLATEEPLRPGRNRDLDRWWRASLPLSCRIPPETRPLDLQKALLAGSCSYPCEQLLLKPSDPLAFWKQARSACPHTALGFDRPTDGAAFGPTAYVAADALRALGLTASLLKSERRVPIVARFARCAHWLQDLASKVRIQVGLPPLVPLDEPIQAPRAPTLAYRIYRGDRALLVGRRGWMLVPIPELHLDRGPEVVVDPPPNPRPSLVPLEASPNQVDERLERLGGALPKRLLVLADARLEARELARLAGRLRSHGVEAILIGAVPGDLPEVRGGIPLLLESKGTRLSACRPTDRSTKGTPRADEPCAYAPAAQTTVQQMIEDLSRLRGRPVLRR